MQNTQWALKPVAAQRACAYPCQLELAITEQKKRLCRVHHQNRFPHNIRTNNDLYLIERRKKVHPSEGSDKENLSLDLDSRCIEKE